MRAFHIPAVVIVVLALLSMTSVGRVCPVPASTVRFKAIEEGLPFSFFYTEGQTMQVKLQLPMPRIIIRIYDSAGNLDTGTQAVLVRAESDRVRLAEGGRSAIVHRGEAHFDRLMVEGSTFGSPLFQLRFNVSAQGHPIDGVSIATGFLTAVADVIDVWALQFPPAHNFVKFPGQPITVVPGLAMPPIRLQIITSEYRRFATESLLENNFTVVASIPGAQGGAHLQNGVARAIDGEIVFRNLVLVADSTLSTVPPIEFVLLSDDSLRLTTGPITVARLIDYAHIAFEDESSSFIFGEGQELTAMGGQALPTIRVSLRDTQFRRSPALTGLVITASCEKWREMHGTIVGVVDGVATFDQLTFRNINHEEFQPYSITFRAGSQQSLPLSGDELRTGIIMVSAQRFPATSIRFLQSEYDSFFTKQGQDVEAVLFTPTPAVSIELLSSANDRDLTTDMSIFLRLPSNAFRTAGSVSCDSDTGITRAPVTNGVATFSSLLFTASSTNPALRLTFVACGNSTVAAYGTALVTGTVRVIPVPTSNADIRFQSSGASLFSTPGIPSFATLNVPLPPVVLELTTSTGILDSSSSDIGITATAPGVVLGHSFLRVSNGMAVFRELTVVTEAVTQFALTFTAGDEGGAPVAGQRLITGPITLLGNPTPAYGIRFHNDSYIAFEGHTVPVTLTHFNESDIVRFNMPSVIIQLVSSDHREMSNGVVTSLTENLQVSAQLSSGRLSGTLVQSLATGVATFSDLSIEAAFDPVMTFCVESRSATTLADIEGRCIRSGPLTTHNTVGGVGGLRILTEAEARVPVVINRVAKPITIYLGQAMPVAIGIVDTTGVFVYGRAVPAAQITASSNIQLRTPLTVSINASTGVAYFSALAFAREVPAGFTPAITFTARFASPATRRLQPVASGLITVIGGAGQEAGVDIVAELLVDEDSFDWEVWRARLCRRLNIEVARIALMRRTRGSSAVSSALRENTVSELRPTWQGTRLELRVMEPLPTSRTTKGAQALAELITALRPSHETTADLFLRRAFLKADEETCDFNVYDEQVLGALECIAAFGRPGYCDCHVPMFRALGRRCVGWPPLTDLCLDTLLPLAECRQQEIVSLCRLLEFPDAPRTTLAASGAFLFLFLPPLVYLWSSGFFHKLGRPSAKRAMAQTLEVVATDASDLL